MKNNLTAVRGLHDLGFAIILLHPKSKRPRGNAWTTGPRKSWKQLEKEYQTGDNVGVRLGEPSKIGPGYLACIDVDIKKPEGHNGALIALKKLIPSGVTLPEVTSGSGNGSKHLYCITEKPFKMLTIEKSEAFEICVYSQGRQMVLPPSIHPNGKDYLWKREKEPLQLLDFGDPDIGPITPKASKNPKPEFSFTPSIVDIEWLPISKVVIDKIKNGTGIQDRSAFLLTAAIGLLSAELTQDEVLSVLTDPRYFISKAAIERRGTDRQSQAQWVWEYTFKKINEERSPSSVFIAASKIPPEKKLEGAALDKQTAELTEDRNWRQDLRRSGQSGDGPPIGNLENVVTILDNAISPEVVKRNEFAFRDTYGIDTPWGGKKDALLSDDEIVKIKYWLSREFRFEPKNQIIEESLVIIACRNAYDPVKDWLNSLPVWDKKSRLSTWLANNFEAMGDPEYLDQVFSKWMLAMVTRAFIPGTKFDWMPIFEGKQGIGKSSFGRLLVSDQYFLDWLPNLTDKDSALGLQGMWSVEMGELANMRRAQLEDVKSYLTRTVDKVRPPYGRRMIESARRCVFFGTTNRDTYLIDDTGNRRFKPIEVGNLNFKALRKDRDQLFAEAFHVFKTKEINELTFELTGKAKIFEAEIHQEKMVEDEATLMRDAMKEFIEKVDKNQTIFDFEKFRILDLFKGGGPLDRWKADNKNSQFAAKMLKKFGARKRMIKGFPYWKLDQGEGSEGVPLTPDFHS